MPSTYPAELMSKWAAAVQAGGWSQAQSGDFTEAANNWQCLLGRYGMTESKRKIQSTCCVMMLRCPARLRDVTKEEMLLHFADAEDTADGWTCEILVFDKP